MKKLLIIGILLGLGLLLFLVFNKGQEVAFQHHKNTVLQQINTAKRMPLFEFKKMDGSIFSKYDLPKDKATVIVYFDPDCELCKKSGMLFSTFKTLHEKSTVLFVSSSTTERIKIYQKKYGLENKSNILFLQSSEDDFYNLFKESSTPTYLIYNRSQYLVKIINDDVPIKIILRYIKASQLEK